MAKSSAGIKIFITLLIVIVALLAGSVVVYKMELIPSFNQKIHSLLGLKVVEEEEILEIQQEEILREETSIKGLFPHLIPVSEEDVIKARRAAQEYSSSIYSKSNLYTVDFFTADREKKSASMETVSESSRGSVIENDVESINSYTNPYPIVASSADFYDTTVFIDAEPALVCLDKETASESLRIPCQVYPLEIVDGESQDAPFTYLQSYYFKSKTGNWYEIRFEKGSMAPESLAVVEEVSEKVNFEDKIYASLLPTKTTLDFIDAKMNSLLSVSPAVKVSESILYSPERKAIAFPWGSVSPAFVFSPQEQGNYTLGLCDKDGTWIREKAFVVLYTMAGEALAISLDYVADRPQITTHLSDQELYIACVGFFPDSFILDEGPADDFREGINSLGEDSTLALDDNLGELNPEGNLSDDEILMDTIVLEAPETTETTLEHDELEQDSPAEVLAYFQVKKAP